MQKSAVIEPLLAHSLFQQQGVALVAPFALLAVFLSSFMSNTAAANLLLPIVVNIPGKDHILLAVTVALSCSFALLFPISTPPNAMAYSTRTFQTKEMAKAGSVILLIAFILLLAGFETFIIGSFS